MAMPDVPFTKDTLLPGEVRIVGPGHHRVTTGGVTLETARALMPHPHMADVVYTDPPWGPPALHMFDSMNGSEYQDWGRFCRHLADAVDYAASGPAFVYMGSKFADDVVRAIRPRGFHVIGQTLLEYGSPVWWESLGRKKRLEATMIQLDRDPARKPVQWSTTMHGKQAILDALTQTLPDFGVLSRKGLVYDPCVGLGIVAKTAAKYGCQFLGSDLNATRLATTIGILEK